ncbi:hypothetical protein HN709_01405 [Candidatus Peregrinibacteria bacterium]|jgi:hypothetical protein|nr:hypothetical protein [Candidatus Peregrinibacteria bacterium]MBT7736319.1 hypothetical protein [Candidatus Peregrinibacteria bacterium]
MKKLIISLLAILSLSVLAVPSASAVTLSAAENVIITQNIVDDAYFVAGNADVQAEIFGDLHVFGGNVTINGTIHEDLIVAGGRVNVNGEVKGDLRVAGGQVSILGNVGDDLLVAGGQVDVGPNATIGGTLAAGSGILTMDGVVKEDIKAGIGLFLLNGVVEGDVVVTIEDRFTVGPNAKIMGDLDYSALLEIDIPEEVVAGEISFNKFDNEEAVVEDVTYGFMLAKVLSFLSSLLLLLMLVLFFPKALTMSAKTAKAAPVKTFGVGVLAMLIGFVAPLILLLTIIGLPLAIITAAMLVVLIYVAKIFAAVWISSYVIDYKKKIKKTKLFGFTALALLAYYLIGMIPIIGWLIHLVLFLGGAGAAVLTDFEYFKFLKSKNMM